jgi:sec-independent protein translocase protein TatA
VIEPIVPVNWAMDVGVSSQATPTGERWWRYPTSTTTLVSAGGVRMRGALEPWHLVILAVVFMALFGAKRLPESAKSLGESLHIFKKSMRDSDENAQPVELKQIPGGVEINRAKEQGTTA